MSMKSNLLFSAILVEFPERGKKDPTNFFFQKKLNRGIKMMNFMLFSKPSKRFQKGHKIVKSQKLR